MRWYNVAYIIGLIGGLGYAKYLVRRFSFIKLTSQQLDEALVWILIAILIGGRLGEALFYPTEGLWAEGQIWRIWEGGMSFHGAALAMVGACYVFAKKYKGFLIYFGGLYNSCSAVGLFLGRIANFINGELYGRITTFLGLCGFLWGVDCPVIPASCMKHF